MQPKKDDAPKLAVVGASTGVQRDLGQPGNGKGDQRDAEFEKF